MKREGLVNNVSSLAAQLSDSKAAATTRAERTHSETALAETSEKAYSRAEPRCAMTCPRNCDQATDAVAVAEFSAATSAAAGRLFISHDCYR